MKDGDGGASSVSVSSGRLVMLSSLALGVLITLVVRGYRFGDSNQAVYLVDALRRADPSLLAHDWWANSTLQYHFVFNSITAGFMRLGILEPAFLVGYLLLAFLMHVAWRKLVLRLGGTNGTYVVSVVLFYVLAGGVGLGMYHFLQDSAFLPSNIANVAMLWGVYFWIAGRPASAGVCLGLAGAFHINHAIAGIAIWTGASLLERGRSIRDRSWWGGTFALLLICAVQVVPLIGPVFSRSGRLPTEEFVNLFVRLRHPHHFDPLSWHWGVWVAFMAPLPFAFFAARRTAEDANTGALRRTRGMFWLYSAMVVLALLTAGFWFIGEAFVQLNLYRFSIYPKLLSCIGAAWLLWDAKPRVRPYVVAGLALLALGVGVVAAHSGLLAPPTLRHPLGIRVAGIEGDDPAYLELATWVRDNTPKDPVFLVPPDEESFRVHARRAIVVNFKGVPQLSGELPEWRDRLQDVLGLDRASLLALPHPMPKTLKAIRERYDSLPPEHHLAVARKYGAQYVVLRRPIDWVESPRLAWVDSTRHYFLYDLRERPGHRASW